jgi:DNA polymerase-4
MDCDAFYASVEKRDNPELATKPVIVGGGTRGVVSTCCYIARISGVRSAMPMFQALKLCPEAVVVKPRMSVYVAESRKIRAMMEELTPDIEPLSLDEAFMDLSGTARLHGAPPAVMLARLVRRMEVELGLTGSIGLSHNKFLAKIASDLDKPKGFSVVGRTETQGFLTPKPVRIIWGVGTATQGALEAAGIRTIADLLRWDRVDLVARFEAGRFSSRDVLALLVAGLRGGGWRGTAADLLTVEIGGGPVGAAKAAAELLARAFAVPGEPG